MSQARFSIIPGWIVTDPRLKGRDLQVLCLLGRYTDRQGWCVRSQVKMAGQLGCARSTVQLSLDRLVDIGAVEKRAGTSRDGRDTSYWYRVIYDRAVAAADMAGWDGGDDGGGAGADDGGGAGADDGVDDSGDVGNHSDSGGKAGAPPADISAPPADPASAPPADLGSAPYKNVPHITSPAERRERDARAREDLGSEGENDPRAIERAFKRMLPSWPTYVVDSEPAARKAWFDLTAEERQAATDRMGDYLALRHVGGRKAICAIRVYLAEKRWEKLPPKEAEPAKTHETAPPLGKAWGALRSATLLKPPAAMPKMTAYQQMILDRGDTEGEQLRRERLKTYGWPIVNRMHDHARERRGFAVPVEIAALGALMRPVEVGSVLWAAWEALHQARGWPWLPDPGAQRYVWMPQGDEPEAAMRDFEAALRQAQDGRAENRRARDGDDMGEAAE